MFLNFQIVRDGYADEYHDACCRVGEQRVPRPSADRRRLEGTDGDVGHNRTDAAATLWRATHNALSRRATGTLATGRRVCRRRRPSAVLS